MQKAGDRDAARRRVILNAARECILKFGYAKSSLEDIAKQATISRPLIYRKFESQDKECAWYGAFGCEEILAFNLSE